MDYEVLGRYQVKQQLGKRAGRRTLLACDPKTQELVVIKVLSFGSDFDWDDLKLFEREAETLKALNHPFIPSYLDYFEIDLPKLKGFALVQTYIKAKSLEAHLKAGRSFNEIELKQLAKSLLEILIYLHGRQPAVIHRDLKPSNILLSNRSGNNIGQVYLVDFGSVQTLAAREGATITVVGTYGYMPQEQFGGRTVPASDLYSLGATLIALVTGTHPADLPQKDFKIEFETASLSPDFANWLRWMTEPTLDRRLDSAQNALQTLQQKQPIKNSTLLTVKKPTGSKVKLKKNADSIEVILPPKGFPYKHIFSWNALLTTVYLLIISGFLFLSYKWMLLIVACFVFLTPLLVIIDGLFKKVRLRIDRKQIYLTYELLGFKWHSPRPSSRQKIDNLEYVKRRFKRFNKQFEINSQLIIWAGVQKYVLNGRYETVDSLHSLTEPELEWLAQELSVWLDIPITIDLPPADQ
ncbi:MAG: serine/threonine-protein kinase [Coleofasciculaceae cyanobacterium]